MAMPVRGDIANWMASGRSKAVCDRIVHYVGDDPKRFAALMDCFFSGEPRVTQRAAWPMSYCIRNHPALAKPYLKAFIAALKDKHAHPGVRRNIVRLLQEVDIPRAQQGAVMQLCFGFIADPDEAAAVKAFSLTILQRLGLQHPGILPEIVAIIESRWDQETPAFHSRARKILKQNAGSKARRDGETF